MTKQEQAKFDAAVSAIEALANERMARLVSDWRKKYKRRLQIQFGMGTACIRINGQQSDEYGQYGIPCPKLVVDALQDIDDICLCYRLACPNDIDTKEGPNS